QHWPWLVSGPLIGLMVPVLLILVNRAFGLSSSLRHICAACFPANISFFRYDWKKEIWNLFFAAGIIIGAFIAWHWLSDYSQINFNPRLLDELKGYGIFDSSQIVPPEVVNWNSILSVKGLFFTVV